MASLKNTKWATEAKEWPKHSSPPKKEENFFKVNDTSKKEVLRKPR
jgi:hypothetical protein